MISTLHKMNSIIIWLSVIFVEFSVIQSVLSVNNQNWTNDVHKNHTMNEPNGIRFQRILHRKKRFLIFPPGSAIVVSFFHHFNQNISSKMISINYFDF